ncbi:MAG TPA: tetratricopeptide repeat protein, partial [Candidatus Eremiobacteraeota bacterium]|nr:tetratricopeptide repeat protein [Candidatus Eremiobacteraeota bacterium]
MPLSRGDEIKGRYKIIDILGKGGMGSVYLAEDWLHKEKCAIKEMLDNFSSDEERKDAIKRFQNEAQILVNIKHKNIPRIIDYFVENNCYYLVMKYIEGKNLQEIIMERKDGKFTEGEVIDLGVKLCDVLSYLHEQKPDPIVFRDIKPANIMFENNGNIMLIDFGIAKILQPRKAGTITGTPGFASPEQYQGFAYPVSDIYSLGATLYYLLSGRNPENSTPFNFPPLEHCVSDVEKVIMKAISMKIEERFQNVLDMKRALIYSRKTEIKMITEMREKVTPEEKVAPEEKVISEEKLEELFLVSEHVTGQSTEILRSTKSLSKKPLNKYIKLCFYITGLIILFICLYSLVNDYYRDRKIDHLCKEAEEFLKKDDYKNAIDRYEEVKKLKSDSIEAFRGAGKVYLKKGEYEHARLSLERAIDIDKDDEESYLTMAKVFWEQKDIFNAEIWYKKVLVINEDNIEAINGLGDCYFARKDYENAIAKYKKLLERDPQNIPLRMKIGYVYKEKKDYTNAIKWFTLALKVKDTFTEARLEIADIYIIVKKYDNAIEEYKKILKYKPQDVEAMSGIGECYKIQQNYDNAMKWF